MTVTCPYCKKKFHKGKTSDFGRLSKHIWRDHTEAHRRRIKKGQRDSKSQLMAEMEYTDDMIVQALQDANIPITPLRVNYGQPTQYAPIPGMGQPVQHEFAVGALIAAFKAGMAIYTASKSIVRVSKYAKSRAQSLKTSKQKGGRGKKAPPKRSRRI